MAMIMAGYRLGTRVTPGEEHRARAEGEALASRIEAAEADLTAAEQRIAIIARLQEAQQARVHFERRLRDWTGALERLDRNMKSGLVDRPTYRRQRAVLLTARALAAVEQQIKVLDITAQVVLQLLKALNDQVNLIELGALRSIQKTSKPPRSATASSRTRRRRSAVRVMPSPREAFASWTSSMRNAPSSSCERTTSTHSKSFTSRRRTSSGASTSSAPVHKQTRDSRKSHRSGRLGPDLAEAPEKPWLFARLARSI